MNYDEIVDILDVKYIVGSTKGNTLRHGVYEITDIKLLLKFSLPKEVKVSNKIDEIDDIRLRSN